MTTRQAQLEDTFGTRLMRAGCALMATAPLLFVIGLVVVAWPALLQLLPRDVRPVASARPGENLMLVATLQNDDDNAVTRSLDSSLVDLTQRYYLYNARIDRLNETIVTSDEARALADEYGASFILWGDAAETAITIEILEPLDFTEPRSITFTPDDPTDERMSDVLASTLVMIFALHNNDNYTADALLRSLPSSTETFGVTESTTAYYSAKLQVMNGNPSSAAIILEQALEDHQEDIHLLGLWAQVARDEGQLAEAIASITSLITAVDDPQQLSQALRLRASLYVRATELTNAEEDLQTALRIVPNDVQTLTQLYELQFSTGDYEAALTSANSLVEANPEQVDPYLTRAELHDKLDQHSKALEDYAAALNLAVINSKRIQVLTARAYSHLAFGDTQAARADFKTLEGFGNPSNTAAIGIGLSHWLEGEERTARSLWEEAYGITPTAATGFAENNLAWELALRGYPEPGLFYSDLSLSVGPTNANFLHTHGYIHLLLGNYEQAIADFDEALSYNVQYVPIYRDLGDAFFGLEAWEEALGYYQDYLRLSPDTPEDIISVTERIRQARANLR